MLKRLASELPREIMTLRGSLRNLERSLRRITPMLSAAATQNGATKSNGRPRLSAKARAFMVLQGRHMGFMRQLKPRQKAQVRKLREAKGVSAAIGKARILLSA